MALSFFKNKRGEGSFTYGKKAKCNKCHKDIGGLAFHCRHCDNDFCDSHRLPEDHNCKPFQDIHEKNKERWQEVFSELFGVRQRYPKSKIIKNNLSEQSYDEEYEKLFPKIHEEIKSPKHYNNNYEETYNPKPFLENLQDLFFSEYWNLRISSKNRKYLELGIAFFVSVAITFCLIGIIQLAFNP